MEVRDYKEEDYEQVEKLLSQYWTDEEFLEEIKEEMKSEDAHLYIAEQGNELVGVAGVRKAPKHLCGQSNEGEVAELYVIASKDKNEGAGSALLRKIMGEVRKRGFTKIVCYSPETHKSSWVFYEKNGFMNCGVIKDPEDGYPGVLWKRSV